MCLGRLLEHFVNVKFDDIVTVIMMSFSIFYYSATHKMFL
jgi:hypothetical protein